MVGGIRLWVVECKEREVAESRRHSLVGGGMQGERSG